MAFLVRDKSGSYHVRFDYRGREFTRSLKTKEERKANALLTGVEATLLKLSHGLLEMPDDAEPGTFIVSGGKLATRPTRLKKQPPPARPRSLKAVLDLYFETLTPDSKQ